MDKDPDSIHFNMPAAQKILATGSSKGCYGSSFKGCRKASLYCKVTLNPQPHSLEPKILNPSPMRCLFALAEPEAFEILGTSLGRTIRSP